jgi:integrase
LPQEWFGTHNIRKTVATVLAEISPTAAQAALGHVSFSVTQKHYVNPTAAVKRALDALPQPAAFNQ